MENKPFWASKTLWANAIAVVAAVTGGMSMDLGLDPETQVAMVGAIMGVVNILLRFVTKSAVS